MGKMKIEILGVQNLKLYPESDADIALIDYWSQEHFEFMEGNIKDENADDKCRKVGYVNMIIEEKLKSR